MEEDYRSCENAEYVGKFTYYKLKCTGTRKPTKVRNAGGRAEGDTVTNGEDSFTITAVVGSRILEGIPQYEVQSDNNETFWCNADDLDCFDLIDEYEEANEM